MAILGPLFKSELLAIAVIPSGAKRSRRIPWRSLKACVAESLRSSLELRRGCPRSAVFFKGLLNTRNDTKKERLEGTSLQIACNRCVSWAQNPAFLESAVICVICGL